MIGRRLVIWLARHPMAAVIVFLGVIAVFTVAGVALLTRSGSPSIPARTSEAAVAPYTLPTPTQHPPQRRVDDAHKALHALGRACETPMLNRNPKHVRKPLDVIEQFATDYPGGGFAMDDESGSTLALLVVVWDELKGCDLAYVPEVEKLIPARYRGD